MLHSTYAAACGTATRPDGSKLVLVAGGQRAVEYLTEVQVYDVDEGQWFMGPELPVKTYGAEAIQTGDSFFVIGGIKGGTNFDYLSGIYEFDPVNMAWITREERMGTGRRDFFVIDVDREVYCN